MPSRILVPLALAGATLPAAASGQAPPAPVPPTLLVRTDLVQVDAVVTDKKGRQQTDLQAADFEVKEDGRVRKITHFAMSRAARSRPKGPRPRRPYAHLQRILAGRARSWRSWWMISPFPSKASSTCGGS